MDLNELQPSERVVEILNPATDEPIGIRVTLLSLGDERLVKIKKKIQDERLRLEARGKNFKADDVDENRLTLALAAMTAWEWYGDVTFNKAKPDFNRKNVTEVLTKFEWLRKQIEEEVSDEKAFFIKSK